MRTLLLVMRNLKYSAEVQWKACQALDTLSLPLPLLLLHMNTGATSHTATSPNLLEMVCNKNKWCDEILKLDAARVITHAMRRQLHFKTPLAP